MEKTRSLEQLALRLSHLADGVDDTVDRLLRDIRIALKGDAEAEHLDELSNRLASALLTKREDTPGSPRGGSAELDLSRLRRLISSMPIDESQQARMQALVGQVAADGSAQERHAALVELVAAAAEALRGAARRDRSEGRVRRWLGRKGDSGAGGEHYEALFAQLVSRLIDHLDVMHGSPQQGAPMREALREVAQPGEADNLLQRVSEELEAIDTRIRAERSQTTSFLGDLQARLDGFEEVLEILNRGNDRSLERSEALEEEVGRDTREIGEAAKSDDVDRLRDVIGHGMQRITERLAEHVLAERQQHQEAKARVSELNERLEMLEQEADVLRGEIRSKNDLALKDALTGVYNRAGYEARALELFSRWQRSGAALSMVFADCNKFKQINDTFGHAAGDLVLVKVAQVLQSRARGSDIVCRYGGDEFVILLPDTPVSGAEVFARAACKEILGAGFNDNGRPLDVSISCGITELIEGDTLERAVSRADEAMYKAKHSDAEKVCVVT